MRNPSFWSHVSPAKFSAVSSDRQYDVVVVGGGITGLTAAWLLKRSGKKVCVLERDGVGDGETQHTSAHLSFVTDLTVTQLADRFGEDNAKLVWNAGRTAIDLIEQIIRELNIDCDFARVPGFLYSAVEAGDDESSKLQEEAALASRLGFSATFITQLPEFQRPAVRYENQALFHPLKYIRALADAIQGDGCDVFEHSAADEFSKDPLTITTNGHRVRCNTIVIATHVPIVGISNLLSATTLQTKLYPYSSYVLHATTESGAVADGLYCDTADPYRYLRVHHDGAVAHLVFGWNDHKTGQQKDTEACYASLEAELMHMFPNAVVHERWTGQVIETSDGLPFIGWSDQDQQFIATGYSGNGLTFGTAAATMAHDAIMGRSNDALLDLFSPSRKNIRGATNVVREASDFPMYLAADWLRLHAHSVADIAPGDAAVLSIDGHKVACHRTETGQVRAVSAVCTHLGCLVRWNNAEATWDCPCHGSRFTTNGDVLGGPAETPLRKIAVSQSE